MKQILTILLLSLIGFTACRHHTAYPLAMQQAEQLMSTRPDSALTLLQGMADTLAALPEETRMYHQLLTIQAKDKQYITHTSDSLINRIVSFYEEYGNSDRLMMAYFYQGSTYRDMNDAPRALKAFQQAVDLNVPNYDLLAKTYNQMGTLFMYQGLHDEVIRVNRKAIETYLLLGKPNKISYAQRDIARMYDVKNMQDSALYFYKEACYTALKDGDSVKYYGILSELGGYYYSTGEIAKAKELLLEVETKCLPNNKSHIYLNLGYIYEKNQKWNSVYHYYKKTLSDGDIYQKTLAYYNLAWVEHRKGNSSIAMEYMGQYIFLKDSIDKITQTETITKISSLYSYQHAAEENANLKLEKERQKNWMTLLLVGIILIFSFIFLYLKKKNLEKLRVERILKQIEEDKYNFSLVAIKSNEKKIMELTNIQKQIGSQKDHLLHELQLLQKEMMELRNREIVRTNNEEEVRIATFQQSSLYYLLQKAASNDNINVSMEDWERIQSTLDFVYPSFRKKLQDLYPKLSALEEQVCWLIKLSITPAGIARIVKRSNSAISNVRSRLHKKIHRTEGSTEMFDEFIKNL